MSYKALLFDYTKSMEETHKHSFIDLLNNNLIIQNVTLIILYGIRPYPLCENNCKLPKKIINILSFIPYLDGPPEPYRAVKEAVEYMLQYRMILDDIILVWSAPRKPLVDLRIAFNLVEAVGSHLTLILTRMHSSRWLTKILRNIEEKNVIIYNKNKNLIKILEKLLA